MEIWSQLVLTVLTAEASDTKNTLWNMNSIRIYSYSELLIGRLKEREAPIGAAIEIFSLICKQTFELNFRRPTALIIQPPLHFMQVILFNNNNILWNIFLKLSKIYKCSHERETNPWFLLRKMYYILNIFNDFIFK